MFTPDTTPQDLAIQSAYLQIVEKHQPKKTSKEDIEKDLEKVADEINEELTRLNESAFESMDGKVRVKPDLVKKLQTKAEEYKASITPEEMNRMMDIVMAKKFTRADDGHKDIHDENGSLQEDAELNAAIQLITEAIGHIDKGAFHKWLGKPEDEPITHDDIEKGLHSDDSHVRKMANFARNFGHIREAVENLDEVFDNGAHILDLSASGRVAKAYAQGKALKIKSAETDGKNYWLHGNKIASKNEAGEHEFDWTGWYTPTTERHLNTILNQVAPGKRINKSQHKAQGVERFTVNDLGE